MNDGVVFSDSVLNAAAQKPLNWANWNDFVRVLQSRVLNLPACYEWVEEIPVEEDFAEELTAAISVYMSDGNLLVSLLSGALVYVGVFAHINSKSSIASFFSFPFGVRGSS